MEVGRIMYKDKKVVVTIEARMTSSRLPGKVLMPFCGISSLEHIIRRMRKCCYADEIVVATTTNIEDNPVIELCEKINCNYYRGSEADVLLRVLEAAKSTQADIIVEITGDCPLIDWHHAEYLIEKLVDTTSDYASNIIKRSFPDGFDTQVFWVNVLEEVNHNTKSIIDHEHVSLYIYKHPEKYKLYNWEAPEELRYPEYEVTLDTIEDYKLISKTFEALYPRNPNFVCEDVIEYINNHVEILNCLKGIERVKV